MLPVALNIEGRKVLIVGGGYVATRRARSLLAEGALVTVVAPSVSSELEELARSGREVEIIRREVLDSDMDNAWLVLAHTNIPEIQERVAAACKQRKIWCLVGGEPDKSSFWMMAKRRVRGVLVSVSAGGNPGRAKAVVDELAAYLHSQQHEEPENSELLEK